MEDYFVQKVLYSNEFFRIMDIYGLINNGNPTDFEWDVLSGVSAGSINTVALAGYPIG